METNILIAVYAVLFAQAVLGQPTYRDQNGSGISGNQVFDQNALNGNQGGIFPVDNTGNTAQMTSQGWSGNSPIYQNPGTFNQFSVSSTTGQPNTQTGFQSQNLNSNSRSASSWAAYQANSQYQTQQQQQQQQQRFTQGQGAINPNIVTRVDGTQSQDPNFGSNNQFATLQWQQVGQVPRIARPPVFGLQTTIQGVNSGSAAGQSATAGSQFGQSSIGQQQINPSGQYTTQSWQQVGQVPPTSGSQVFNLSVQDQTTGNGINQSTSAESQQINLLGDPSIALSQGVNSSMGQIQNQFGSNPTTTSSSTTTTDYSQGGALVRPMNPTIIANFPTPPNPTLIFTAPNQTQNNFGALNGSNNLSSSSTSTTTTSSFAPGNVGIVIGSGPLNNPTIARFQNQIQINLNSNDRNAALNTLRQYIDSIIQMVRYIPAINLESANINQNILIQRSSIQNKQMVINYLKSIYNTSKQQIEFTKRSFENQVNQYKNLPWPNITVAQISRQIPILLRLIQGKINDVTRDIQNISDRGSRNIQLAAQAALNGRLSQFQQTFRSQQIVTTSG